MVRPVSISCRDVTRLLSEAQDRKLPADEELRLRAHLAICRGCRSLSERFAFLRRAMRKIADTG